MYGPTAGDRVRLGDTHLFALIERDYTDYGNEILGGWGKNLRTGMMYSHRPARDSELDNVISNAIIMDPVMGIFKGSIGTKDGTIVGVGRAGNPDIMDDVDLVIGPNTVVYRGDGLIATPGGVDSHVHLGNNPKLMDVALSAGLTTLVGRGSEHHWALHDTRLAAVVREHPGQPRAPGKGQREPSLSNGGEH